MPKVINKGQVTIPKKIREVIGIKPGSGVEFKIHDGKCIVNKVIEKNPFQKWVGYLKINKTTDQIMKDTRYGSIGKT